MDFAEYVEVEGIPCFQLSEAGDVLHDTDWLDWAFETTDLQLELIQLHRDNITLQSWYFAQIQSHGAENAAGWVSLIRTLFIWTVNRI